MGKFEDFSKSLSVFQVLFKVSKGAKIRNRYNKVPHLTQDTKSGQFNFQGLFESVLYIQVLFKPVQTLCMILINTADSEAAWKTVHIPIRCFCHKLVLFV